VVCLGVLVPLTSLPVHAATHGDTAPLALYRAAPKMTPDKAAALRVSPQSNGRAMVEAGDATGAGMAYDAAASEYGDPILYLDAGDAYLVAAKAERDEKMCDAASERASIALDILYFHIDDAADERFLFVEPGEIAGLIARAQILIDQSRETKQEIADEASAPVAAAAAEPKEKGDGKFMRIGGLGLATVGGALTVMGVVGLGLGASNQSKADDPSVYGSEYDSVEASGERANLIAGVGFGVGGAALVAGITLYFIGKRRGKKAGAAGDKEEKASEDDPIVRIAPTLNGMAVSGRF